MVYLCDVLKNTIEKIDWIEYWPVLRIKHLLRTPYQLCPWASNLTSSRLSFLWILCVPFRFLFKEGLIASGY